MLDNYQLEAEIIRIVKTKNLDSGIKLRIYEV